MPVPMNNPAGRLYTLLDQFRQIANQKGSNATIAQVWAGVWNCKPTDAHILYPQLVAVQKLIVDVRQEVEAAPGVDQDLFLRSFPRVESFIALTNLDNGWQSTARSFDDIALTELAFCANHLALVVAEEVVPPEELSTLLIEVEALIQQIRASSLEMEIRGALLTVLETIRHATSMYSIHGAAAFHRALVFGLGELALHHEVVAQPQNKDEVDKLTKILTKVGGFARFTKTVLEVIRTGVTIKALISGDTTTSSTLQ